MHNYLFCNISSTVNDPICGESNIMLEVNKLSLKALKINYNPNQMNESNKNNDT